MVGTTCPLLIDTPNWVSTKCPILVCTPNWVWVGVDVWRLDGLREGLAGVAEVGCCTDDQGAESEVGAPRVADIDLKGRLLALAKKRAKVLVSRSAVDAGAGTIADHIVDGLFECMLRDHGGWWMLGVDLRILSIPVLFYAALFLNSKVLRM